MYIVMYGAVYKRGVHRVLIIVENLFSMFSSI
jgi:hypothetical protein